MESKTLNEKCYVDGWAVADAAIHSNFHEARDEACSLGEGSKSWLDGVHGRAEEFLSRSSSDALHYGNGQRSAETGTANFIPSGDVKAKDFYDLGYISYVKALPSAKEAPVITKCHLDGYKVARAMLRDRDLLTITKDPDCGDFQHLSEWRFGQRLAVEDVVQEREQTRRVGYFQARVTTAHVADGKALHNSWKRPFDFGRYAIWCAQGLKDIDPFK